jgi:hypothetical protein
MPEPEPEPTPVGGIDPYVPSGEPPKFPGAGPGRSMGFQLEDIQNETVALAFDPIGQQQANAHVMEIFSFSDDYGDS